MNLIIRELRKDEQNFIFSSWIKNYILGVEAELQGKNEAAKYLQAQIQELFDRGTNVIVYGDTETDEIYSYVVYDTSSVYFIYTKSIYRKNGLARNLIEACKIKGKTFPLLINPFMTKILATKYDLKFKPTFTL